jgi:hypothetical protein
MQDDVVGDVARCHCFAAHFDPVEHLSGDGDGILEQFLFILCPYWFHRLRHQSAKPWCDFIYKQTSGLCVHFGFLLWLKAAA